MKDLEPARGIANILDRAFRIPGTNIRFGLDPLLGLIPGLGDVVGGAASAYMMVLGARMGAPKAVLARMVWNVAVDAAVGTVPVLGDLFDVGYKANVRNLQLLERWSAAPVKEQRASTAFLAVLLLALLLIVVAGVWLAISIVRWFVGLF